LLYTWTGKGLFDTHCNPFPVVGLLLCMSKQRVIKDEIWDDDWFYDLDPSEKLIWIFLLTNPRANITGIFKVNTRWVANLTGFDKDVVNNVFKRFVSDGKILWENDWIGIVNFHKHLAYSNPNMSKGIVRIHLEFEADTYPLKGFQRLWVTLLNSTLLNLSDSEKNSLINILKEKSMSWKPYNENAHSDDVPSIDGDTREIVVTELELQKQENVKITANLKVLAEMRGLLFADIPTQRKFYHKVLALGYTHKEIAEELQKCIKSKYWVEQKQITKQLPDLKSVFSAVKNKT